MKKLIFIGVISLTGCALSPVELASKQNVDLCINYLTKPSSLYRSQVISELNRRGENCSGYQGLATARMNSDTSGDALISTGMSLMRQGQPQPVYAPSRSIDCQTWQYGNNYRTTCN